MDHLKMKNKISAVKNTIDGINNILDSRRKKRTVNVKM